MKNLSMLVWLTQLGISVVAPLGGFVLLSVWLRHRFDLGIWVVVVGIILGIIGAVDGLWTSLKAMERTVKNEKEEKPALSFNDHE